MRTSGQTIEKTDRKYQMRRLGKGDYLLASNDLAVMWRIHTYVDGRHHGLDVPYEERTFWRLCWMPMAQLAALMDTGDELPDPWDDQSHAAVIGGRVWWHETDWFLPSRQAAIDLAMEHDARREGVTGG